MTVTLERGEQRRLEEILSYVRAFHEHEDIRLSEQQRLSAIRSLLGESRLGRIFLIRSGSRTVGYVAVCFGYSIEFEGRDAFVDEIFIEPESRGMGHGQNALRLLKQEMERLGIKALHLEVDRTNEKARHLYHSVGFEPREKYFLMSAFLSGTTAEIHAEAQIRAADAGGSELIDRASQEETS
jgi:ribosomal protein S18 acetylase RimI-like enzyme